MPFCSNCGADVEENQRFCPECGTRLSTESVSPAPPTTTSEATDVPPPKQGILSRVDIDQEDIDEVAEKAKKGLGAAWRIARRGISKGAELAEQGIEAAKDTIEDRRAQQAANQAQQPASESVRFCPNCGQPVATGKFCNHCGHKLG